MGNVRTQAGNNPSYINAPLPSSADPLGAKGTLTYQGIILPEQIINLPCAGDFIYFEALSDLIYASTLNKFGKSPENPYYGGTGMRYDRVNAFRALELRNPSSTDNLFFNVIAGFDNFIDNRLNLSASNYKQVSIQTYSAYRGGAAATATIEDLSGTVITDDNGNEWYAVNRQLILLFNNDGSEYWFLTNTADTKDEGSAQPLTNNQFPVSGDFKAKQGTLGNTLNGIITEIYNCLPKLI